MRTISRTIVSKGVGVVARTGRVTGDGKGGTMRGARRVALVAIAALSFIAAFVVPSGTVPVSGATAGRPVVAMLMSDNNTARWFQVDVPNVTRAMHALLPSAKVLAYNANSDTTTQLSQARTAIGQGAKVLIVVSVDPIAADAIVKLAHENGATVIAYEHQIEKAPTDYFVGFDPVEVGRQEGQWVATHTKKGDGIVLMNGWTATSLSYSFRQGYMEYLEPLFKSGARKLVGQVFTPQWLSSDAQSEMEAFLAKGEPIAAVLSENDQMAGGVAAALKGAGLTGKVELTGLDSDVAALQRILEGSQSMTIHPEFYAEALATAKIATALLTGKKPSASVVGHKTFANGVGGQVPWVVVPTIVITKQNMQRVITEGYVTKAVLCKGVPKEGVCA